MQTVFQIQTEACPLSRVAWLYLAASGGLPDVMSLCHQFQGCYSSLWAKLCGIFTHNNKEHRITYNMPKGQGITPWHPRHNDITPEWWQHVVLLGHFWCAWKCPTGDQERDLGVVVENSLEVLTQGAITIKKANAVLGVFRKRIQHRSASIRMPLYKSKVWLNLWCQRWKGAKKGDGGDSRDGMLSLLRKVIEVKAF